MVNIQNLAQLEQKLYDTGLDIDSQIQGMKLSSRLDISDEVTERFRGAAVKLIGHLQLPYLVPKKLEIADETEAGGLFQPEYKGIAARDGYYKIIEPTAYAAHEDRSSQLFVHEAMFPGTPSRERYIGEIERSLEIVTRIANDELEDSELRRYCELQSERYQHLLSMYTEDRDDALEALIIHELGHAIISECKINDNYEEAVLGNIIPRLAEEGIVALLTRQASGFEPHGEGEAYLKFEKLAEEALEGAYGESGVAELIRKSYDQGVNGLRRFGATYKAAFTTTLMKYIDEEGKLTI